MPLLITPAQPLASNTGQPVTSFYAVIDKVHYERRGLSPKVILCEVGYYAHASASLDAAPMLLDGLPPGFAQPASPEEANALPIFSFLEALLTAKLEVLLPGAAIVNVA
jgi:hypothetical protein